MGAPSVISVQGRSPYRRLTARGMAAAVKALRFQDVSAYGVHSGEQVEPSAANPDVGFIDGHTAGEWQRDTVEQGRQLNSNGEQPLANDFRRNVDLPYGP